MPGTTIGLLLRSSQALCGQLCDKQTLDYGIAYSCPLFADLAETNQFREVVIERAEHMPLALAQVEQCFQEQGLRCHRWVPALGQPVEALGPFLADHGFQEHRFAPMTLIRWVKLSTDPKVRILPARALRKAYRATFLASSSSPSSPAAASLADAYEQRLDDPPFDAFVAMVAGEPAGRGTLFQVGDIARVMDLVVLPGEGEEAVGEALLAHVLTLAKRLTMRHICVQVPMDQPARRAWLASAGFVEDGEMVEYERDATSSTLEKP